MWGTVFQIQSSCSQYLVELSNFSSANSRFEEGTGKMYSFVFLFILADFPLNMVSVGQSPPFTTDTVKESYVF